MKITASEKDPLSLQHQLLVLFCNEGGPLLSGHSEKPPEMTKLLQGAAQVQRFKGAAGKELLIPATGLAKTPQILLVGLGKPGELKAEAIRRAAACAAAQARRVGAERVGLLYPEGAPRGLDAEPLAQAVGEGFLLGLYRYERFKTSQEEEKPPKVREIFCYPALKGVKESKAWAVGLKRASALAAGVNLARDLSNAPANEMPPVKLGQEAQRVARLGKMTCKVLGPLEIKKEKMGGLLAVSQGSEQPPRFIVLEYKGSRRKAEAPIVVIGKGITFDSGGISLKPAPGMDEMKHDMSGAAAVIGLFSVLRELTPKLNVVGIAACAENMPSGKSYRPGDIVTTRSGKTVEVLNTDAEGRMVLIDALDYAKKYKPKAIIDLATLTGACVVALGHAAAGLMSNDEPLKEKLLAAAEASGERIWPFPLYEDYTEAVKSEVADLKNVGGRDGGVVTAGAFLQEFVEKGAPWAHLDIAGTAWLTKPRGLYGKGATGFGVRLLAAYLGAMG